ncbi:phage regulatory CII family protein [Variovorax ginsengisoli]|uniref:Transcriptional regulator n=1 Tax=Variovorax ginsengisoli TaxID=363844 RepID=A0ABT8S0Y0_9BURK|nr:phage regulatory CII family protein [Variovorax ginsengisoli]MDN8612762.1 transcriptional regulator [Variovorax ginsengisoli]MDO1531932.1 transcriptional regulator [Variovorax ginsengisoli]
MNSLDALRKMVDHYPGGRAAIAVRLGKTDEVLRKELSGSHSHKLGMVDAETIAELCHDAKSEHRHALVNTLSTRSGGFISLPVFEMPGAANLQRTMSDVIREMSDVSISTIEGDADGVISDNDLSRSLKEIEEARTALQVHEVHLRSKNAAGKPVLRAA